MFTFNSEEEKCIGGVCCEARECFSVFFVFIGAFLCHVPVEHTDAGFVSGPEGIPQCQRNGAVTQRKRRFKRLQSAVNIFSQVKWCDPPHGGY